MNLKQLVYSRLHTISNPEWGVRCWDNRKWNNSGICLCVARSSWSQRLHMSAKNNLEQNRSNCDIQVTSRLHTVECLAEKAHIYLKTFRPHLLFHKWATCHLFCLGHIKAGRAAEDTQSYSHIDTHPIWIVSVQLCNSCEESRRRKTKQVIKLISEERSSLRQTPRRAVDCGMVSEDRKPGQTLWFPQGWSDLTVRRSSTCWWLSVAPGKRVWVWKSTED